MGSEHPNMFPQPSDQEEEKKQSVGQDLPPEGNFYAPLNE